MKEFREKLLFISLCCSLLVLVLSTSKIKASSNETVLDVLNGNITITDKNYVQKNSKGEIVSSGTVTNNEIILTGYQNNYFNVYVNGSNLPTIHYRDITSNGNISGSASGNIKVVFEGSCNIRELFSAGNLPNITQYIVIGLAGNKVTGLTGIAGNKNANRTYPLLISNVNINVGNNTNLGIENYGNITVDNSKFGSACLYQKSDVSNMTINNCSFEYFIPSTYGAMTIDNVTSLSGCINSQQSVYPQIEQVIKNSNLKLQTFISGYGIFKIIDSTVELSSPNSATNFDLRGGTSTSMYIKGSTIITPNTFIFDFLSYSDKSVCIVDSSINLNAKLSSGNDYTKFRIKDTWARFDPLDDKGNRIYLNKIKVPNVQNAKVTVSINNRSAVTLTTDKQGYLYLYLPQGQHTVNITDSNNVNYTKSFNAASTNDSDMTDNDKGIFDLVKKATIITTPFLSSDIQYSYDRNSWVNITTNESGSFSNVLPDNTKKIFVKLKSTGEVKYAEIVDGVIGTFKDTQPIITDQSESSLTFIKGSQGILYVNAEPYTLGNSLSYQWKKDDIIITGATKPILCISSVKEEDAGNYVCVIKDSEDAKNTTKVIKIAVSNSVDEATLVTEIKELNNQVKKLQKELETKTTNNTTLQNTIDEQNIKITKLNNDIETLKGLSSKLQNDLNKCEADKEELAKSIQNYTTQIDTLNQTVIARDKDLDDTVIRLNDAEQAVTDLNTKITNLKSQIIFLEDAVTKNNEVSKKQKELIGTLENNIIDLDKANSELQNSLDDINNVNISLQEQLDLISNELNSKQTLIEDIKTALSVSEDSEIINAIQQLKNENDSLKEEIASLKAQLGID